MKNENENENLAKGKRYPYMKKAHKDAMNMIDCDDRHVKDAFLMW